MKAAIAYAANASLKIEDVDIGRPASREVLVKLMASGVCHSDWHILKGAKLHDARACSALVADFSAELPDEWEAFLADAALAGRIVYQVKQLAESLTGRVELEHLSENMSLIHS